MKKIEESVKREIIRRFNVIKNAHDLQYAQRALLIWADDYRHELTEETAYNAYDELQQLRGIILEYEYDNIS